MSGSVTGTLRGLYREVDGFEIDRDQERRVERTRGSAVYGEIMPSASLQLIDALQLGPQDTFVDLGSGVGKLVLTAALGSKVGLAIGVELARDRHNQARSVLRAAQAQGLVSAGVVQLRNQDIMRTSLAGATVLYTCSTAFPYAFTERLAHRVGRLGRRVRFVTLQALDCDFPGFALAQVLRLDMSWARKRKVHVYTVGGP